MRRGEELGILRALPDGRIEVISPRLQQAAAELAELGIGPEAALETAAEELRRHSEALAAAFVDLFVKEIWEPFDRAGRPEEDWPQVREALDGCARSPPAHCSPSSRSRWARRPRRPASAPCAERRMRTLRQACAAERAGSALSASLRA